MPAPAGRSLVSEQVFSALLEALLSGRYAPGEKLPTQRALAADLGVTMTSLREALKRLEQMGLVESRQGDAMRVRDWRAHGGLDVIAHLLFRSGGLDAGVLADLLEARGAMLREVAALAAERRDDAQARRLTELAGALRDAEDDDAAQRVDFAFFTELAEASRNVVFMLIVNSIRELYFAHAERVPVTARHDELAGLYIRVAGAVARGDAAQARAGVGELDDRQRARVQDALREAGVVSVTRRETNIFACVVDTVVAPGGGLPELGRTDAVEFLDGYLAAAPAANRIGLRAMLHALEVGPLLFGYGARLRRLPLSRRLAFLDAVQRTPAGMALQPVEALAKLAYYGDLGVMRELGYDPEAVVGRGREVRVAEGRW